MLTVGAGKLIVFVITEKIKAEYSNETKRWVIINHKCQIIGSHSIPCGTPTQVLDNNILCHSISTPKSATMFLISSIWNLFPPVSSVCFCKWRCIPLCFLSHFFFGMSAEKQHKLFSSCHRPKYTLYSPQLSDLLMRIYVPSGVSHRRIVMPSGEKLLVLWLAATQWGIKRLLGFIVFVLPKRLQNKDIKTVWTDTLKLLLVLLYNCISDIDYSFLKMSSKA